MDFYQNSTPEYGISTIENTVKPGRYSNKECNEMVISR
jgi:hypothetical protein